MAEWRKVAKAALLADGHISKKETEIVRKEIFADGEISKSELDFLHELKKEAKSVVKDFDILLTEAEKAHAASG